jgi:hypothetical protein
VGPQLLAQNVTSCPTKAKGEKIMAKKSKAPKNLKKAKALNRIKPLSTGSGAGKVDLSN